MLVALYKCGWFTKRRHRFEAIETSENDQDDKPSIFNCWSRGSGFRHPYFFFFSFSFSFFVFRFFMFVFVFSFLCSLWLSLSFYFGY
jgi:hypothetical protein